MPITFSCPCGRVLRAADEHAGRDSQCPVCGRALTVPAEDVVSPLRPVTPEATGFKVSDGDLPAPRPPAREYDSPAAPPAGGDGPRGRPRLTEDDEDLRARRPSESYERQSAPPVVVSKRVVTGLLMMAAGVVLFLLTFSGRRPPIFPIFLFIGGLVSFVKGLAGAED